MDLEERMLRVEKELAVTAQMSKTHREELNLLFEMFRKHMEKEEEQRDEVILLIGDINTKLNNQRSFWAGIVFAFSVLSGLAVIVWQSLSSGGHHG